MSLVTKEASGLMQDTDQNGTEADAPYLGGVTRAQSSIARSSIATAQPIGRAASALRRSESPIHFLAGMGGVLTLLIALRLGAAFFSASETPAASTADLAATGSNAVAASAQPSEQQAPAKSIAQAAVDKNVNAETEQTPATPYDRATYKIRNGETLSRLLKRAGFDTRARHDIASEFSTKLDLRKIRPGQKFTVARPIGKRQLGERAKPTLIEVRNGFDEVLTVSWIKNQSTSLKSRTVHTVSELKVAEGIIEDSLFLSANKAGVPLDITIAIANIYAFSVDFQRDLRRGDGFQVLYRERYAPEFDDREAEKLVLSTLTLRGKEHDAIWHVDTEGRGGYYDRKGASARRALMKTPIDGARLTSRFGRRKHPILGYRRMHKGLDFGAPRGTPVKAAGDGTIEMAKRNGSFGKYIRIRHGNNYKTAYAHLNGYAKGIRAGRKVQQGDIIGYVGTTGRSTGPHLHYEVLKNGVQINPSTLRLPRARQLAGDELRRFESATSQLMATYQQTRSQLADNRAPATSDSASR